MSPKTISPTEALLSLIEDPVRFSKGILREQFWSFQNDLLRAIDENPRVAVKGTQACGKTRAVAGAILHFACKHPKNSLVITTAPGWKQVESVLWQEVASASHRSRIQFPPIRKAELELTDDNRVIGLSTNEAHRFAGFHADYTFLVLDEAPGIKPEIWDAIEGIRAGGQSKIVLLGQPLSPSGPFYEAFTKHRANWKTFSVSAFDTPNLKGLTIEDLLEMEDEDLDDNMIPSLTTRRWVRERYVEWGKKSPRYQARVLGQFPEQAEDALISLAWIEEASTRPLRVLDPAKGEQPVDIGIDVAGPGEDETVAYVRCGPDIIDMIVSSAPADGDARGEILAGLRKYKSRHRWCAIDVIGIGWFFAKHMNDNGFRVYQVNVGERASDPEQYANLRAELHWGLRMRFHGGGVNGLKDETTKGQLAAMKYKHNARGQIIIESKDEMRKRGVKSPDRGEALMLAYATDLLGVGVA